MAMSSLRHLIQIRHCVMISPLAGREHNTEKEGRNKVAHSANYRKDVKLVRLGAADKVFKSRLCQMYKVNPM